jgi:hypothetical protein
MAKNHKVNRPRLWPIDDIHVGDRKRSLNEAAVVGLLESMKVIGLKSPIIARRGDAMIDGILETNIVVLVAGLHRLEAAKRLEWDTIECSFLKCDEIDAQLIEIAENLHRAELTAVERAEQIAEWSRLTKLRDERDRKKAGEQGGVSGQNDQKLSKRGRKEGRPKGGTSAAARALGLSRKKIERAEKIASIVPEAKAAARAAGIVKAGS